MREYHGHGRTEEKQRPGSDVQGAARAVSIHVCDCVNVCVSAGGRLCASQLPTGTVCL